MTTENNTQVQATQDDKGVRFETLITFLKGTYGIESHLQVVPSQTEGSWYILVPSEKEVGFIGFRDGDFLIEDKGVWIFTKEIQSFFLSMRTS